MTAEHPMAAWWDQHATPPHINLTTAPTAPWDTYTNGEGADR